MGGSNTKIDSRDKAVLAQISILDQPHELRVDQDELSKNWTTYTQKREGKELRMCFQMVRVNGRMIKHYFLADDGVVIEFGSPSAGLAGGGVNVTSVHERPGTFQATLEDRMEKTRAHEERLKNVLGATSFSMLLRNSEHFARYVLRNLWASQLTMEGEAIHEMFKTHIDRERKQKMYCKPRELIEAKGEKCFWMRNGFIKNPKVGNRLSQEDVDNGFNMVFLGPTGVGKSHLINLLFNREVCKSSGGAQSETQEMTIIQGEAEIGGKQNQLVNIVDTIGFCDTRLERAVLHKAIRQFIQATLMTVHKVVVAISSRLQPAHEAAIKEFLGWLDYRHHKHSFSLVYTGSENLSAQERQDSLRYACGRLGMDFDVFFKMDDCTWHLPSACMSSSSRRSEPPQKVPLHVAVGFAPLLWYYQIEGDLHHMLDAICTPTQNPIQIDTARPLCPIL